MSARARSVQENSVPVSRRATDRGRAHNLDNTSLAVKDVLAGRDRVETKAFEAFRGGYPFRAEFCAPAKGWEKGSVETVRQVRP